MVRAPFSSRLIFNPCGSCREPTLHYASQCDDCKTSPLCKECSIFKRTDEKHYRWIYVCPSCLPSHLAAETLRKL